jgi:hypothetical protein
VAKSNIFGRLYCIGISTILMIAGSAAQQLPAPLIGNSIKIGWDENVTETILSLGRTHNFDQSHTMSIYLGSRNRVFSTLEEGNIGTNPLSTIKPHIDEISSNARADPKGTIDAAKVKRSWRLERGALIYDQLFDRGARRVSVRFDNNFRNCRATIIYGKNAAGDNIRYDDRKNGRELELVDSRIISTNCRIVQGNLFASQF